MRQTRNRGSCCEDITTKTSAKSDAKKGAATSTRIAESTAGHAKGGCEKITMANAQTTI
jgi:hypothetical protein